MEEASEARKGLKAEVAIAFIAGSVPVEGKGKIGGRPFYFRACGAAWSLSIGGTDPARDPEWRHWEEWGTWPDAGYMEVAEAEALIRRTAAGYLRGEPPGLHPGNGAEPFGLTEMAIADVLGLPASAARLLTDGWNIPYLVWRGERWSRRSDALACREKPLVGIRLVQAGFTLPKDWKVPEKLRRLS